MSSKHNLKRDKLNPKRTAFRRPQPLSEERARRKPIQQEHHDKGPHIPDHHQDHEEDAPARSERSEAKSRDVAGTRHGAPTDQPTPTKPAK